MSGSQAPSVSHTRRILSVVLFNLLCYIDIGLPMAVIPVFVHQVLGYNTVLAGFAVSIQYLATFASRASAGRQTDRLGAKPTVVKGLAICTLSGVMLLLSGVLLHFAMLSIVLLILSRILLGVGESWTATGAIMWNIGRVGAARTAQVISWNGITSYGGIALGAPIGQILSGLPLPYGGLTMVGVLSAVLALFGFVLARRYDPVPPVPGSGPPMPFRAVFMRVLPHGLVLACGSVGFGTISACLALFYANNHWDGAAVALTGFGLMFCLVRFLFARQIDRRGGLIVTLVSLLVETLGLVVLWRCHTMAGAAIGAILTGAGFSLVFPAMGVLAVTRVGPENRGAALGAFSVFLDIAVGLSGPLLGLVIQTMGYGALFLVSALFTLAGVGATIVLKFLPR
ncbi:MFS transporter [Komagataeibacter sp. FNDCR2]|uniref:MFS transporter n=1 Tax=Komagataeibacter sp. FNDCR2 TaxID=2878682 RepID=UPI001E297781|nr:MFS transporter [Komagataeibacter sp. FNDCR2]MCE2575784.1 MFS transporter [Komagataeibacter sp. FNDCR2]